MFISVICMCNREGSYSLGGNGQDGQNSDGIPLVVVGDGEEDAMVGRLLERWSLEGTTSHSFQRCREGIASGSPYKILGALSYFWLTMYSRLQPQRTDLYRVSARRPCRQ